MPDHPALEYFSDAGPDAGRARRRLGEPVDIDQPRDIARSDDADHAAPVDDQGTASGTDWCHPLKQRGQAAPAVPRSARSAAAERSHARW